MKKNKFQVKNESIQKILKDIGSVLGKVLPSGWGFALMIFNFEGEKTTENSMFYISNAQRPDMIKAIGEFKGLLESDDVNN